MAAGVSRPGGLEVSIRSRSRVRAMASSRRASSIMSAERTCLVASWASPGNHPAMRHDRPDWARLFFSWIVNAVAVALAAWLLGGVTSSGVAAAAFAGLVLGLVNAYIKPVLTVLGIPFIIITLG